MLEITKNKQLKFLREACSTLTSYEKTGLHCNHQEVTEWLNKLAGGFKSERPKYHIQALEFIDHRI